MRDFGSWLNKMRASINGYDYYVDFEKVYNNVNEMKVELNILNSLIGSQDIENEFLDLVDKYPQVLKCIPTLLACRQMEIYCQDKDGAYIYDFNEMNYSKEQYIIFMRKTKLFDLLSNHIINNLVDYCLGVEVGLDSNGRKNRGGHQMEDLVEEYLKKSGVEYYKEMYLQDIEKKWGVDLSYLSSNNTTTKRWDFVVKTNDTIYVIETNFYSSGGSKLNETSRSYKLIAQETKKIQGVEFIWLTDGNGWKSARRNLEETFNEMDYLLNIDDLEQGILVEIFKR